jgi:mRNA interferase MazF
MNDGPKDYAPPAPAGTVRLKAAPKPRQIYWCEYPEDAIEPEFWKKRPVVVISRNNSLRGPVTVLPMTTGHQPGNKWAVGLTSPLDQKQSWIICNHPTTFSTARLWQPGRNMKTIPEEQYGEAIEILHKHLVGARS